MLSAMPFALSVTIIFHFTAKIKGVSVKIVLMAKFSPIIVVFAQS